MPLASFIIPVYNCEQYIVQCLDSILAQSVSDFEVIIIDDGSTDNSGKICDDYVRSDSRFTIIHKQNAGLSAARNDGIRMAEGEWLTFVDSDDWLEPCFLEVLLANQDVDYVVGSMNHCRIDTSVVPEKFNDIKFSSIDSSIFADNNLLTAFFTAWSKFFNTRIVKENKLLFIPGVSPGEDTIFVMHYLSCIQSICLSSVLCYNWRVANGLTNKKRSFSCVQYTINQTIDAINAVEGKHNVDLTRIKYNSLNYLVDKIDILNLSNRQLYQGIKDILTETWMADMINDNTYLPKGRRRHVFDVLLRFKALLLSTFVCRLIRRFY